MMRIISVVGLNSGQDEDVHDHDQQLEGVESGRAQASSAKRHVENSSLSRLADAVGGHRSRGEMEGVLKETRHRQVPKWGGIKLNS